MVVESAWVKSTATRGFSHQEGGCTPGKFPFRDRRAAAARRSSSLPVVVLTLCVQGSGLRVWDLVHSAECLGLETEVVSLRCDARRTALEFTTFLGIRASGGISGWEG